MLRLFQKILVILAAFTFLVSIAILLAAWYLGAFAPVQVYSAERGPYLIVAVLEPDSPAHIQSQIDQVKSYLQQKGEPPVGPVGVYYRDPLSVTMDEVEASAGWVVRDSVAVDTPFILITMEKQLFAIASIRINPALAPFKTYPALQTWMERSGYHHDQNHLVLELYHPNDSMEVQVPITEIRYDSLSPY